MILQLGKKHTQPTPTKKKKKKKYIYKDNTYIYIYIYVLSLKKTLSYHDPINEMFLVGTF